MSVTAPRGISWASVSGNARSVRAMAATEAWAMALGTPAQRLTRSR
ncbi:hypothetical protein [Streptomyces fractus]